eukprot:289309-Prymnesium_polylepis.1
MHTRPSRNGGLGAFDVPAASSSGMPASSRTSSPARCGMHPAAWMTRWRRGWTRSDVEHFWDYSTGWPMADGGAPICITCPLSPGRPR